MAGLKADPLRELLALQQQIAQKMERLGAVSNVPGDSSGSWSPAVDLYETPLAFVLKAELPGFRNQDVTLTVEGRVLTLRGVRQPTNGKRTNGKSRPVSRVGRTNPLVQEFHRMEREYGTFQRSFTLPGDVDPARVSTRWSEGVFEVRLPKKLAKAKRGTR